MNDRAARDGVDPVVVDLVLVSLRVSSATVARAGELLDDGERTAASARNDDARRRYVVAHAALRKLVAARLGADPARVTFGSETGGRPVADGLAFSLSHSGDHAAIAMTVPGVRIGVDLERIRARRHLDGLARRVFDPDEYAAWFALPPRSRPRAFAQRWTEIESVLKARGTGIAGGIATARAVGPGWSRAAFAAGAGCVGTVAVDASPMVVTTRRFRVGDALRGRAGTAH